MEDRKKFADALDISLSAAVQAISTRTELVEECDWDEELASSIINDFIKTTGDIAIGSSYDKSILDEDLMNLVRLNMKIKVTDNQFKVLAKLLMLEAVQQIRDNRTRN